MELNMNYHFIYLVQVAHPWEWDMDDFFAQSLMFLWLQCSAHSFYVRFRVVYTMLHRSSILHGVQYMRLTFCTRATLGVRYSPWFCGALFCCGYDMRGPFYYHGLTLIPALIHNYIHYKVWGEIIYPFPNFNGATVEVCEWISNFIPHFNGHVIAYPCSPLKLIPVSKAGRRCRKMYDVIHLPISFKVSSLSLAQSYDYPWSSEVPLKDLGKTDRYQTTT